MTSGGDRVSESEVIDRGRWSIVELGRRGLGTGGLGVPSGCGTNVTSDDAQGGGFLDISSEARAVEWTSSCLRSSLRVDFGAEKAVDVGEPESNRDMCSK